MCIRDRDSVLADQNQVVCIVHDLDAGHAAVVVVADTQATAVGDAVIINAAAASLALFGNGQHAGTWAAYTGSNDIVSLSQLDDTHTVAGTAHSAGAALGKVDGGTIVGGNDDLIVALGQVAPYQAVALVQGNGNQTRFANVTELGQRRALNEADVYKRQERDPRWQTDEPRETDP